MRSMNNGKHSHDPSAERRCNTELAGRLELRDSSARDKRLLKSITPIELSCGHGRMIHRRRLYFDLGKHFRFTEIDYSN